MQVGKVLVAVRPSTAVMCEQLNVGFRVVVNERAFDTIAVGVDVVIVLTRGDGREVELPDKVNCVLLRVLPLEYVGVGTGLVFALETCEDKTVVAVVQVPYDFLEHHGYAIGKLHRLRFNEKWLILALLGVLVEEVTVRLEDLLLKVAETFGKVACHENLTIEDEAVEDKVAWLAATVGEDVYDKLAVEDGVDVELGLIVARDREVWVTAVDPPVLVLPIDEVVDLFSILGILCHVKKIAHAI